MRLCSKKTSRAARWTFERAPDGGRARVSSGTTAMSILMSILKMPPGLKISRGTPWHLMGTKNLSSASNAGPCLFTGIASPAKAVLLGAAFSRGAAFAPLVR